MFEGSRDPGHTPFLDYCLFISTARPVSTATLHISIQLCFGGDSVVAASSASTTVSCTMKIAYGLALYLIVCCCGSSFVTSDSSCNQQQKYTVQCFRFYSWEMHRMIQPDEWAQVSGLGWMTQIGQLDRALAGSGSATYRLTRQRTTLSPLYCSGYCLHQLGKRRTMPHYTKFIIVLTPWTVKLQCLFYGLIALKYLDS